MSESLESGGLRADRRRWAVALRAGRSWRAAPELTRLEFELLWYLLERAGRPLSRAEILGALWPGDDQVNPEAVDKHVAALRRKLGAQGQRLVTLRGLGYALK